MYNICIHNSYFDCKCKCNDESLNPISIRSNTRYRSNKLCYDNDTHDNTPIVYFSDKYGSIKHLFVYINIIILFLILIGRALKIVDSDYILTIKFIVISVLL